METKTDNKPKSKFWSWFKSKFLTQAFLSFIIIGVINTIINFFVMKGVLALFDLLAGERDISSAVTGGVLYYVSMGVSTLIAFVAASLFSYFANAHFTYKQDKKDKKTFNEAIVAYVMRFICAYLFTLLIWWLILAIFHSPEDPNQWLRTLANFIASALVIPPFYLVLEKIFNKTRERIEKKKEEEDKT